MKIEGKRIVILGGTSGIGLAVALQALDEGASVLVASKRQEAVDSAQAQFASRAPSRVTAKVVDVASEDAIKEFFGDVGPIDHLVYTAGEDLPLGPLRSTDLGRARERFEVRYWGAFAAVKYGVSSIQKDGSIVLTSGFSATRPRPGWTSQASIQAAVEGLTRALALELAPIRVNAVSPGVARTPRWNAMAGVDREALYKSAESQPVSRAGTADEIAAAYIYLMENTYATGNIIKVDGGGALV
jgi:NAD(P)-dependent dehydrogenase (short-subunit alcohol dehydrogenase family)